MTGNSIRSAKRRKSASEKPKKPYTDFPLFPHATGRWAKKIRGKLHYFGYWRDKPNDGWKESLERYQDQRDDLHAGRTPRVSAEGLTIRELCNRFLTAKQHQCDCGEITPRTFSDYRSTTDRIVAVFGRTRLVNDLATDDFEYLRTDIAKTRGLVSLGNEIQRVRVVFKYGYDANLFEKPIRYGPLFKRPSKRALRRARIGNEKRMFEAAEIRTFLGEASTQMSAMILLGVNCGFGNHDVGSLPMSAVDLKAGWIDFPRPKTGIHRRCPLWQETVDAIRATIAERPATKHEVDGELIFITKYGRSWVKETSSNPISAEFRKLIQSIDAQLEAKSIEAGAKPPPKLYRKGIGFYALRHVFETIGGESRDQVAVDHIMGHEREDMASVYRERISDERLTAVTNRIWVWLFGDDGME